MSDLKIPHEYQGWFCLAWQISLWDLASVLVPFRPSLATIALCMHGTSALFVTVFSRHLIKPSSCWLWAYQWGLLSILLSSMSLYILCRRVMLQYALPGCPPGSHFPWSRLTIQLSRTPNENSLETIYRVLSHMRSCHSVPYERFIDFQFHSKFCVNWVRYLSASWSEGTIYLTSLPE